jgi:2OG-Fe(II) oxygenase superfamily
LVAVCEEAKFGLGNKDVLDPSYRKAWKLDASKFALQFDLVSSGILQTVHDALLHYEESSLVLEAHLDKMNVYGAFRHSHLWSLLLKLSPGPGSFFKSHVDTPRDKNMIATLVVVLPTEHKGGDLLLMNKNWTFDSANLVSKEAAKEPRLAFVAFYSDIDHEVTPVESGYRVTVTYNLYCSKPLSPAAPKVSLRVSPEEVRVREAIRWILEKEDALPKGGVIAFGLTYKYPIDPRDIGSLNKTFRGILKGGDALIERACQSLNLDLRVQALYTKDGVDPVRGSGGLTYLTRTTSVETPDYASEDAEYHLKEALDDVGYSAKPYDYSHKKSNKRPVLWLTTPGTLLETSAPWIAYGNEASISFIYGTLVLTADVPPYDQRKAVFDGTLSMLDVDSGESSASSDSDDRYDYY